MQKKKIIAPILFLYHDEGVCPWILKYNKVYFLSSLITKPSQGVVTYVFCELLQLMIVAVASKGVGCWRKIGHLPNCNFLCQ